MISFIVPIQLFYDPCDACLNDQCIDTQPPNMSNRISNDNTVQLYTQPHNHTIYTFPGFTVRPLVRSVVGHKAFTGASRGDNDYDIPSRYKWQINCSELYLCQSLISPSAQLLYYGCTPLIVSTTVFLEGKIGLSQMHTKFARWGSGVFILS